MSRTLSLLNNGVYQKPHYALLQKVNTVKVRTIGWRTRQHCSTLGRDILESKIRSATIWMIDKSKLLQ